MNEPIAEEVQEPGAAEVQDEAVTTDLTPDPEGDTGAVADAVDDSEPTDLASLWQRHPALKEAFEAEQAEKFRERENAGANRERARLQREAGKKEVTRTNVTRFLSEIGADFVEDTSRVDYLYELAAANSAMELATAIPEAILRNYALPADVREQAIAAREAGDWDGYVTKYVDGAASAKAEQLIADKVKQIEADNVKWRAAELRALRAETAPKREGALAIPSGSPAVGTRINPATLDGDAYAEWKRTTSQEEQQAAWAEHARVPV